MKFKLLFPPPPQQTNTKTTFALAGSLFLSRPLSLCTFQSSMRLERKIAAEVWVKGREKEGYSKQFIQTAEVHGSQWQCTMQARAQ